jgi:hypothetical protein
MWQQRPVKDRLLTKAVALLRNKAQCSFVNPSTKKRCPRLVDLSVLPKARIHYENHGEVLCKKHFQILKVREWRCQYWENGCRCQAVINLREDRMAFRAALFEEPVFCERHRNGNGRE